MAATNYRHGASALALFVAFAALSAPAHAQDIPLDQGETDPDRHGTDQFGPMITDMPEPIQNASSPDSAVPATIMGGPATYIPENFVQFAPRNARDMLNQVPGFSIRGQDNNNRGLGQATGNVLINGERLSSKSESAQDQLSRIPADKVVRIEILDGASLDIPGLSGQIANVIIQSSGISGQFEWQPQLPTDYAAGRWSEGEISISGNKGAVDFTLALSNEPFRGGSGGPTLITNAHGQLIERRDGISKTKSDFPKVSGQFRFGLAGEMVANLNMAYQWKGDVFNLSEDRFANAAPVSVSQLKNQLDGHKYEIGGDIEFPFGPGRFKLIALEAFDRSDFTTTEVLDFGDAADPSGTRFAQFSQSGERIVRAEYNWPLWGADWQISGEAAFNRLDNVASFFRLDPDINEFAGGQFDAGTGGVTEDRYETLLSYGRAISSDLTLQIIGGAEFSRIAQTGSNAEQREFWRPKGSASLSWVPGPDFDVTFLIARQVGQLNFSDFLADVNLDNDNANAGNNQLVPDQSWLFEIKANRNFGDWGSASLRLFDRRVEDLVTIVPLFDENDDLVESQGNIASARRMGIGLNGTLNLDPIGIDGAKINLDLQLRDSKLVDPLTGEERPIDFLNGRFAVFDFRHDIPGSDIAWGVFVRNTDFGRYHRIAEVGRNINVETFGAIFIEHKNVFGLTMRVRMANLLDGRSIRQRTVYTGPRNTSPIDFIENRNRAVGTIWNFSVKGNF